MIPKKLIQFWHDPETLPEVLADAMELTRKTHQDFEIIQANDEFMYQFIGHRYSPAILSLYQMNKIPSSRSDIARLMLLYEYGGVYVDASMEFTESFGNLINDTADIILILSGMPRYDHCPEKAHVINGIMAAPAKSEFIRHCLKSIFNYLISGSQNHHVNIATGPDIINSALRRFEQNLNVKKIRWQDLQKGFVKRRSVPGVSNTWPTLQRDGIIDPEFYKQNARHYEKSWILKNKLFHFSFSMLSTK